MNNIKKGAIGVLVAGLALGVGIYSTKKTQTVYTYYKTDTTTPANNPSGYKYYSSDRCEMGGTLCSAQWDLGNNPAPTTEGEALPTNGVTFQTGTTTSGHFE